MFIFLLQLREALEGRPNVLLGFAIFAGTVWFLWGTKTLMSRRYRTWTKPFHATTSVIIPVVDEPEELFEDVLARITSQEPDEVLVVINGERNLMLEEVCQRTGVSWTWTPTPGKRNAIRIGVERCRHDIVVLVDSDTLWTADTLSELLKPFADERIGGVTTKQRILEPERSFFTRWADWMENSRARYSLPAQSVTGQVGCLPGRTIAFRRSILVAVMKEFMTARFLGVFLEISDDRTLTNLTLKQGYRTAFQETSLVYTDAPTRLKKLTKQQLRWARGSQYNTARMLPWMLTHAPVLSIFFIADVLLPFLLVGSLFAWGWHARTHTGVSFITPILAEHPGVAGWLIVVAFIVTGSMFSMWLRQFRHLMDVPSDWTRMPAYVLFSSFYLMPIRLVGFFCMGHVSGWGTRRNAYKGETVRGINVLAGIPYLAGALLIGAQIAAIVHLS